MINKNYLPSKKFVISLSIAIVIIIIAIIFNYSKSNTTKYTADDSGTGTTTAPDILTIDSDSDDLPDWKENLYGTNPKKEDTDEDGTKDGQEVAQSRDPLKANTATLGKEPNDKISVEITEENKKALEEYERLNELDKLSRNLVSDVIAAQPVDGGLDSNTIDAIVTRSVSDLQQKDYFSITKIADLNLQKTNDDNRQKNMSNYVNNYAAETFKLSPILGLEMIIVDSYYSGNNAKTNKEMADLIDKYQNIVNNLIKMPIPITADSDIIDYHLAIINDLEKIIAVDKDILASNGDSLMIYPKLSIYYDLVQVLIINLKSTDSMLNIQR